MDEIFSVRIEAVQNTTAVSNTAGNLVEMEVRTNQGASFTGLKTLVINIELAEFVTNDLKTPYFAHSSRVLPDQITLANDDA